MRHDEYVPSLITKETLLEAEGTSTSTQIAGTSFVGYVTVPYDSHVVFSGDVYNTGSGSGYFEVFTGERYVDTFTSVNMGRKSFDTSSYVTLSIEFDAVAGEKYCLYTRAVSDANGSGTLYRKNCTVTFTGLSDKPVISDDLYMKNDVKSVFVNTNGYTLSIDECPRLDRCEFDHFVSGTSYGPTTFEIDGVLYVKYVPPYCTMRVKY